MVKTLACSKFIKWTPPAAVKAKKAIEKNKNIFNESCFSKKKYLRGLLLKSYLWEPNK